MSMVNCASGLIFDFCYVSGDCGKSKYKVSLIQLPIRVLTTPVNQEAIARIESYIENKLYEEDISIQDMTYYD